MENTDANDTAPPPEEILRGVPAMHPRTNFEKVRTPGQRTYKKQKSTNADDIKLGGSAVD